MARKPNDKVVAISTRVPDKRSPRVSDTKSPRVSDTKFPRVSDTTLRAFTGYVMKRAFNVIQADVTRTLEPFELRMVTYSALAIVGDNPGLSQSQLAGALAIERPNLVVIIDELERRDLLSRDRVPTDRRAYALRLTTEGARLLAQATDAVRDHEARMMAGLTDEDLAQLTKALARIESADTGRTS